MGLIGMGRSAIVYIDKETSVLPLRERWGIITAVIRASCTSIVYNAYSMGLWCVVMHSASKVDYGTGNVSIHVNEVLN